MKPISIVIITLNEEKRIARLLSDLSTQTYQQFEVIVVDSNSEDLTTRVAEKYQAALPDLTVHTMTERGVSLGRNTGAGLAKYERILFLDADVRLDREFLELAAKKLESEKLEVAGVFMGARQLTPVYKAGYGLFNAGLFATQFFFPTAVGACIFSTKRAHHEIGGFDEEIVLCEDCNYVKKAAQTWRFRFLPLSFQFDPRRLEQDGFVKMGATYLKANIRRFFFGEMRNNEMKYKFGHYQQQ